MKLLAHGGCSLTGFYPHDSPKRLNFRSISDEQILTFPGIEPETQVALLALKNIFTTSAESLEFLERLASRLKEISAPQRARLVTRTILYLWHRGQFTEDTTKSLIDSIQDEDETMRFKTGRQIDREADIKTGIEQGLEQGDLRMIHVIENMLSKGSDWGFIESITYLNQADFEALKAKYCK